MSTPSAATEWNPRYVAYARAHGKTPDAMLVADKQTYSGGCMVGFMLWMGEQWAEFMKRCPHSRGTVDWDIFKSRAAASNGDFDTWQAATIP